MMNSNQNYKKVGTYEKWSLHNWPLQLMDSVIQSSQQDLGFTSKHKDNLIEELVSKSDSFPISFPVETVRIKTLKDLVDTSILAQNAMSTYPIMHERTLCLFLQFLEFKRKYGTKAEKNLYKDMTILDFVDRILLKRSVVFCGSRDTYMLLSKEEGCGGWENIGTSSEKSPLHLKDCLSYDEMKLSALLYVSGTTVFINDGSRKNCGVIDPNREENIQKIGVIIGLVGARIHRVRKMEYEECILTSLQNTTSNGFGPVLPPKTLIPMLKNLLNYENLDSFYFWRQLWFNFYSAESLTFDIAKSKITNDASAVLSEEQKTRSPLVYLNADHIFNNELYAKRLSVTFDVLLLEANERAHNDNTTAYIHVVGIGLGVWKISQHQTNVFINTFMARIVELLPQMHSVSDVHFAYFEDILPDYAMDGMIVEDAAHPLGGIKIHISKREPSSKLTGDHSGKLLVETYAWDSNAHPGNEFWMGSLYTSGDPAAACSTQVAELHNAHINGEYVSGKNLHIAGKFGVKHIAEYCRLSKLNVEL